MSDALDAPEDNPDGMNPFLEDPRDGTAFDEPRPSTESEELPIVELLMRASEEFDRKCEERHQMGAEKYGPAKFLTVDTLQEALDEIIDLANYARFTYIKLRLLQATIVEQIPESISTEFISAKQFTAPQESQE